MKLNKLHKAEGLYETLEDIIDGKGDESFALHFVVSEAEGIIPELFQLRARVSESNYEVVSVLLNDFHSILSEAQRSLAKILQSSIEELTAELYHGYTASNILLDVEDLDMNRRFITESADELHDLSAKLRERNSHLNILAA